MQWTKLRPHKQQSLLWRSKAREVVVCAGRGSGKTELARRRVVSYLAVRKPWTDPKYFYALPTYSQAKRVAWDQLLALIPKYWMAKPPNVSDMVIETVFGSRLYVFGLDNPARAEGVQWDGGVVDESSDQKPGTYDRSLRPALTHRDGWCWRIGVPKRFGPGAREFKDAFSRGVAGEAGMEAYTWPSWDILPEAEIELLRQQFDTKDFNEQIGGRWEDAGGTAYYEFSKLASVRPCTYRDDRPILIGSDFNVDPMAWVLAHLVETPHGQGLEIFDEIWLRNTNTRRTLDLLYDRYSTHRGGWVFTGDATGRSRKTSAASSDYKQIQADKRFKARVKYDKSNPAVKDRLAAVNLLCCNSAKQRRLFVDPRCVHLIDDLENRAITPYGEPVPAEPGQKHDSGHATDALGYLVYKYFPVTSGLNVGSGMISVYNG